MDDGGRVLTLKQCPRMALIQPHVDLTHGSLTLTFDPPTPYHVREDLPWAGGEGHATLRAGVPKRPAFESLRIAIPRFREWEERRRRGGGEGGYGTTAAGAEGGGATSGGGGGRQGQGGDAGARLGAGGDGELHGGGLGQQQQRGDPVVRLDAGLAVERVRVCGDSVCSDLVSGREGWVRRYGCGLWLCMRRGQREGEVGAGGL